MFPPSKPVNMRQVFMPTDKLLLINFYQSTYTHTHTHRKVKLSWRPAKSYKTLWGLTILLPSFLCVYSYWIHLGKEEEEGPLYEWWSIYLKRTVSTWEQIAKPDETELPLSNKMCATPIPQPHPKAQWHQDLHQLFCQRHERDRSCVCQLCGTVTEDLM